MVVRNLQMFLNMEAASICKDALHAVCMLKFAFTV